MNFGTSASTELRLKTLCLETNLSMRVFTAVSPTPLGVRRIYACVFLLLSHQHPSWWSEFKHACLYRVSPTLLRRILACVLLLLPLRGDEGSPDFVICLDFASGRDTCAFVFSHRPPIPPGGERYGARPRLLFIPHTFCTLFVWQLPVTK